MGEYLFIASAIFSIVNGTVLLWVNPRRLINRVLFASSMWIAAWFLCVVLAVRAGQQEPFESRPVVFWIRASSVVAAFSIWVIWLMKSVLLEEHISAHKILKQSWAWFIISLALVALSFSESFIASSSTPENKGRGVAYLIHALTIVSCCSALLVDALRQLQRLSGVRKIEMQFFVIGTICACLLAVASTALGLLLNAIWLRHSGSIWFSILHGVTVWALCSHRIFDAKQVVLSIGHRLFSLAFVGFTALAVYYTLNQFIETFWSLLWATTVACAAGIALDNPTRRWAGLDMEHLIAAPRSQIIEWARVISTESELQENFALLFRNQCQTHSVLFLCPNDATFTDKNVALPKDWLGFIALCKDGWTTPETLQRSRTRTGTYECAEFMQNQKIGALVAVPKGIHPPSLVIGLGQKESLRPYTFPDIQMLLELGELMDNILTHSRVATHAAHIERMASVSMISRGLAHDLNNLATPVSTFLHHMDGRITPGTTEAKVLADAKSSIRVMQDYIQESLFFARKHVPNFTVIAAHSVLNDVIRLSSERACEKNIRVILNEGSDFCFVADFSLLRRLLQNLVFNSIDASANGETIEISAITTDEQQVCWLVSDHGSGIPPEIRNRIFEPYFTTKNVGRERRGLGLGLAICQKIAELHGGRILVSENSPRGTVFTTTFPRRNTMSTLPATTGEEPPPLDRRQPASVHSFGPTQTINGAYP